MQELLLSENSHILLLRLLRVFLAVIAGSGLAVCGITLQAILRNPLAEPYLLGTSSGAGLGAVIAIILGAFNIYLPLAAFAQAVDAMNTLRDKLISDGALVRNEKDAASAVKS